MEKLKVFAEKIKWLYRPIVVAGIMGILTWMLTYGPTIVMALQELTFDSVEQKIRFKDYFDNKPTDVDLYIQSVRHDSIMVEFLNMRDSMLKNVNRLDTITNRNAVTIYQMKQDQKVFFEKVLERLIRN